MNSPSATAEGRINIDSLLPTHLQPRRAYTLPLLDQTLPPRHHQPVRLVVLPESGMRRWFAYIVGVATIVGLVVAIIAVVVK